MSIKENIMRQLSIFLYQKLYSTGQEILGQVEQALTLALNQVELQEINQHLDYVTNISETNSAEVSLPLMTPTHPSALESYFTPNVEVAPKYSADQSIHDQDYFLDETETKKEEVKAEGQRSEMNDFMSFDDVGKDSDEPKTQLSDGLPSDFANDSDDSTEEWWVRHGAQPTVKTQQRSVSEQPFDSKDGKRTKTRERKYSCEICGRSFSQKGTLERHKRKHTGERLYSCNVCGKAFTQRNVLNTHKRTHTGEKPFSCNVCGESFIQKISLKRHEVKHRAERPNTDTCEDSDLKEATQTHSGEHKYCCGFCGKGFIRESSLSAHLRHLSGAAPHLCDICGQVFCQKVLLVKHKSVHS